MKRGLSTLSLQVAAALLIATPALAQMGMGPSFGSQVTDRETAQKIRMKRCYDRHRAPEDRAESCKAVMDQGGNDVDSITVAQAYIEAGKYDDALAMLALRFKTDPGDSAALAGRATINAAQGQYDLALADANIVVKASPNSALAYNARCWVRAVAGRELDAALADCDKALSIAPRDADTWNSRGLADYKRGDMKAAIADYDKAVDYPAVSGGQFDYMARLMGNDAAMDESSSRAASYYMRGLAKRQSGDADGGDKDIEDARNRDPYVADEYARLGVKP